MRSLNISSIIVAKINNVSNDCIIIILEKTPPLSQDEKSNVEPPIPIDDEEVIPESHDLVKLKPQPIVNKDTQIEPVDMESPKEGDQSLSDHFIFLHKHIIIRTDYFYFIFWL